MDSNNGGKTVLMTVIGVATLLVALVGATFAYFSIRINNENSQSISVTTATPIGLTYTGGQTLTLQNALPGDSTASDSTAGQFTVANDSQATVSQSYDLSFIVDTTTFTTTHVKVAEGQPGYDPNDNLENGAQQPNQLLLKVLSATTTGANSGFTASQPTATVSGTKSYGITTNEIDCTGLTQGTPTQFVNDQPIAPGETHRYQLQLVFVNLATNQDENQGASFTGHVEISDPKTIAS